MSAESHPGKRVHDELGRDWVLWQERNDVDLRLAILALLLKSLGLDTELVLAELFDVLLPHDDFFFA